MLLYDTCSVSTIVKILLLIFSTLVSREIDNSVNKALRAVLNKSLSRPFNFLLSSSASACLRNKVLMMLAISFKKFRQVIIIPLLPLMFYLLHIIYLH